MSDFKKKKRFQAGLFSILLGYCLVFLVICIVVRVIRPGASFKMSKIFNSFSWVDFFSGLLGQDILLFIVGLLILHVLLAALLFLTSSFFGHVFHLDGPGTRGLAKLLALVTFFFILLKNAELFPRSVHSVYYNVFVFEGVGKFLMVCFQWSLTIVMVVGISGSIFLLGRKIKRIHAILALCFGLFVFTCLISQFSHGPSAQASSLRKEKPNIFLIGIDSLRPDHVGYYGYSRNTTPNIDKLLAGAVNFMDAFTPLGRTFPSWVGVLTGLHPKSSGARCNLINQNQLQYKKSLPDILKENGYTTALAMDERRFANFDETFGFDHVIGPKMGAADFLLGYFGDLPLANLAINTSLGKVLFPFHHANRGVYKTYQPSTFSDLLANFLEDPHPKPLFFAAHFCLPHYPYRWSEYLDDFFEDGSTFGLLTETIDSYDKSLVFADNQAGDLLDILKKKGLLEDSIVIVLSDHGESFGFTGNGFLLADNKRNLSPGKESRLRYSQRRWHGTSVLDFNQNHCVLAVRDFRTKEPQHKVIKERVSLLDISPTILDCLGIKSDVAMDGLSLKPFLGGEKSTISRSRKIFLETGFYLTSLGGDQSVQKMVEEGVRYYRIDRESGRMVIKDQYLPEIIGNKERGLIQGDHYLAVTADQTGQPKILALNLVDGKWTSDMDFIGKEQPYKNMFTEMTSFYKNEIPFKWSREGKKIILSN